MRIAIGTSDRINTEHFGRAKGFIIYQWNGDESDFVEYIETNINPEEKHQWSKNLSTLEDCEVVIVAQAGMKAKYGIKKANLKLVEDEGTVEEVLERFIKHERFMGNL
ncbi:MAG: dinitrogenase iron-molybdenum cofactor biosynthesis protein [Methanobacteriales archaeon HGW-Methanobacteriales-2]|jgi:predicted Fe-Mo cluster-binding NifX family protein|nr:MAG: dinitrogenase iron-molybdenum cofactor biosynthesis protein [Methanobacteriales archaeon HGW-Methanobacteriales-2]